MNPAGFNLDLLAMARDLRGFTQKQLAEKSGLSQGFISKVLIGSKEVSEDSARQLATALSVPMEFLFQREQYTGFGISGISMVYYRKREGTLKSHLKRLQAEVNLRRIHVKKMVRDIDIEAPHEFQFMDIDDHGGSPEDVAIRLRASWMLPMGPVKNLVAAIENAGGIVFRFPFGTTDIDAMGQWPDDSPPLFFVNSMASNDRTRFSLAHELGHVVMHKFATETSEEEADKFAAEFLLPCREIGSDLRGMSLSRAAALKPHWGVSMAALVYRAKVLGRITDSQARGMFIQLSKLGYKKREPNPLPAEEPTIVERMVKSYLHDDGLSIEEIGELMVWDPGDISKLYLPARELRLAQ